MNESANKLRDSFVVVGAATTSAMVRTPSLQRPHGRSTIAAVLCTCTLLTLFVSQGVVIAWYRHMVNQVEGLVVIDGMPQPGGSRPHVFGGLHKWSELPHAFGELLKRPDALDEILGQVKGVAAEVSGVAAARRVREQLRWSREQLRQARESNATLYQLMTEANANANKLTRDLRIQLQTQKRETDAKAGEILSQKDELRVRGQEAEALVEALKQARDSNSTQYQRYASAWKKASDLQKELDKHETQHAAMEKEQVAQIQALTIRLAQQLRAALQHNITHATEIAEARENAAGLRKVLDQEKAKLQNEQRKALETSKALAEREKLLSTANSGAAELKEALEHQKAEHEKKKSELNERGAALKDAKAGLAALRLELQSKNTLVSMTEEARASFEKKVKEKEAALVVANDGISILRKKLVRAEGSNATLTKQVNEQMTIATSLRAELQSERLNLQDEKRQHEAQTKALEGREKQLREANNGVTNLQEQLSRATADKSALSSEVGEAKSNLADLRTQIARERQNGEAKEGTIRKREEEIEAAKLTLDKLKGQVQKTQQEDAALKSQLADASSKASSLGEALEHEKSELTSKQNVLRQREEALMVAQNGLTSLRSELQKEKAERTSKEKQMHQEAAEKEKMRDLLRERYAQLRKVINEMEPIRQAISTE